MSVFPSPFAGHVPRDTSSVVLSGEIDLETAVEVKKLVEQAIVAADGTVTIDMGAVTYLGSSGLHVLLTACDELRQHQRGLFITRASPQVRRLLDICGLTAQLMSDVAEGQESAES